MISLKLKIIIFYQLCHQRTT